MLAKKNAQTSSRSNFTGKIGFVLAAAGSAVGLGNLWRFPYCAAKYGGGMFLLLYTIIGVISLIIGFILVANISSIFAALTPEELAKARVIMIILVSIRNIIQIF